MKMEIERIARDMRRYLRSKRALRFAHNPMTQEIVDRLERAKRNAWKSLPEQAKAIAGTASETIRLTPFPNAKHQI